MAQQGICTNALIIKENKILMVKRSPTDHAYPGHWELPGGKIEYKEAAESSLFREVQEECGLDVQVHQPLTVNHFYIGDIQYFEITYLCTLQNGHTVQLSDEHTEYTWIKPEDVHTLKLSEYMQSLIKKALANLN